MNVLYIENFCEALLKRPQTRTEPRCVREMESDYRDWGLNIERSRCASAFLLKLGGVDFGDSCGITMYIERTRLVIIYPHFQFWFSCVEATFILLLKHLLQPKASFVRLEIRSRPQQHHTLGMEIHGVSEGIRISTEILLCGNAVPRMGRVLSNLCLYK